MNDHLIHFSSATIMGWVTLQVANSSIGSPIIEQAIKAAIALIVGTISALITSWVNKKFPNKST